ncbi:hypothetical protein [Glycocaulis sp.]
MRRVILTVVIVVGVLVVSPVLLAALAFIAYAAVGWGGFLLSNADTSCHNVMRGFKMSASPIASAAFEIELDEIQDLEELVRQFAADREWSLASGRYTPFGSRFSFSTCTEPGVTIVLNQRPFGRNGNVTAPFEWSGSASLVLFVEDDTADWYPAYIDFTNRVGEQWPLRFLDGGGRSVSSLEQSIRTNPTSSARPAPPPEQ